MKKFIIILALVFIPSISPAWDNGDQIDRQRQMNQQRWNQYKEQQSQEMERQRQFQEKQTREVERQRQWQERQRQGR